MKESFIQQSILAAWGAHPRVRLWRKNSGKVKLGQRWVQFGVKGWADIGGILAPTGRILEIECKTDTGRPTPEQLAWLTMIQTFGGVAILARSLEDVDRVLIPIVGPR